MAHHDEDRSTTLDRREFAARVAAAVGATATGGVIGFLLPADAAELATDDYDWTRHRWVYLIDIHRCIGCGSCVRACRAENDVPAEFYRTWIERYAIPARGESFVESPHGGEHGFRPRPQAEVGAGKSFFVPKMCNHCDRSPCIQVCPVGASYETLDGVVLVDHERCIGCGYCVQACPYGSRFIDPDSHTASKCTWCYHRITRGLRPACVETCPTGTRVFGDREDPDDPINAILATRPVLVLQPELLTKPQCYYLGLDSEIR